MLQIARPILVLALTLGLSAQQLQAPVTSRTWAGGPVASFAAAPSGGPAALLVQFADRSLGRVDTWTWDFGDGSGSNLQHPTHVYDDPGTYTVTLNVSGPEGGDTSVQSDLINVDSLPAGFIDEQVLDVPQQTTGFIVLADNDLVIWLKEGKVLRWFDGSFCPEPMVDITEEVGNWNDHGLHGFVFDADYDANGYVYLYYVVDRHHLDMFGTPAYGPNTSWPNTETIGRITRYTVFDPSDPATTVDPATRTVLVGEDAASGVPICSTTHGIGRLAVGHDGTLLFSCGDAVLGPTLQEECLASGITRPAEQVEQFRAQLVDSASGKIHRIDPLTGDGDPSNPFYDAVAPRSWRSRVWALGLRNPYRFAVGPERGDGPGNLFVGDVGNSKWEELSLITAGGQNLGWPFFEGLELKRYFYFKDTLNLDAPNPLYPSAGCQQFFKFEDLFVEDSLNALSWPNPCDAGQQITSVPIFIHRRPLIAWGHDDYDFEMPTLVPAFDGLGEAISVGIDEPGSPVGGLPFVGNASIGGTWYGGTAFPEPYRNVYFHGDYGEQWIRAFSVSEDDQLTAVHDFAASAGPITFLTTDPDHNYLYFLRYHTPPSIRRISFGGNAAPTAAISSTAVYGPAPLRVEFSAADSNDPEGAVLEVAWNFGTDEPWTPLHALAETVHLYPSEDITSSVVSVLLPILVEERSRADGTVAASNSPTALGPPGGMHGAGTGPVAALTDGIYPARGSSNEEAQVVVRNTSSSIGFRLDARREIIGLVFQEGLNEGPSGGWLEAPLVESLDPATGTWVPVTNLRIKPAYPADLGSSFETFHISFDPVDARSVRMRDGHPSASPGQFTVGELRLIASPDPAPTGPTSYVATVTVTDDLGAESSAGTLVSANNTPPVVEIVSPGKGQTYPVGSASSIPLEAIVADAEHTLGSLTCDWNIELVHDNHAHPEPVDTNCSSSFTILPHNELEGDIIYWRVELRVTDPAGLSTTAIRHVRPDGDCNLNGFDDALDIAIGTSRDQDSNGIPDECEGPNLFPYVEGRQTIGGGG